MVLRKINGVCLFFLFCISALSDQQVVPHEINALPTSGVTRYCPAFPGTVVWESVESNTMQIVSAAGTISDFYVSVDTAPGAGKSRTWTFRKNGVDTSLSVTISGTATSSSNTGSFSVSAGDKISYKHTDSGSPTIAKMRSFWKFNGSVSGDSVYGFGGAQDETTSTDFITGLSGIHNQKSSEANVRSVISTPGTIKAMYVGLSAAPGSGDSRTLTLRKNGSNTAMAVTISDTATTGFIVTNVSVVAGDLIACQMGYSGTPATCRVWGGLVFNANTNGQFMISVSPSDAAFSSGVTEYNGVHKIGHGFTTSENFHKQLSGVCTIQNVFVQLTGNPGVGKSYAFTFRTNAVDTSLSVTVSGTATATNFFSSVPIAREDFLSTKIVPSGVPDSVGGVLTYTGFIEESGPLLCPIIVVNNYGVRKRHVFYE